MAGLGPIEDYTSNFKFRLVNFNWIGWGDFEHKNWEIIDAVLYSAIQINNIAGVWDNNIAVVIGDRYIDSADGTIWEVLVPHTTAAAPTTFSADRTANPTYWTQVVPLRPVYKGAWAVDTEYIENDFVSTDDHRYLIAKNDHTSSSAPATIDTDIANWEVLVDLSATVTAAEAAQTAAETAQTAAELAQTGAETAETGAQTAETGATTQAGIAAGHAATALSHANDADADRIAAAASAASASSDAGTATTQAGIATAQASAASGHAANALSSANAASTSETNAAASETNAATSETNAAASATNAAEVMLNYKFATPTLMDTPGDGYFRSNAATWATTTKLAFDDNSNNASSPDVSSLINTFADSTQTIKGYLLIRNLAAAGEFVLFNITGLTDNAGWTEIDVTYNTSNNGAGRLDADDACAVWFTRNGDVLSDAQVETAYNNQVAQVSGAEITAGTETGIRRYSPANVKAFVDEHATAGVTETQVNAKAVAMAITLG